MTRRHRPVPPGGVVHGGILLDGVRSWYCPRCGARAITRRADVHTEFHTCPKLLMMNAPMVLDGLAAKIELVERQDYVGQEMVQLSPERRRPVMNITITRDEGTDAAVYAPTATARIDY